MGAARISNDQNCYTVQSSETNEVIIQDSIDLLQYMQTGDSQAAIWAKDSHRSQTESIP